MPTLRWRSLTPSKTINRDMLERFNSFNIISGVIRWGMTNSLFETCLKSIRHIVEICFLGKDKLNMACKAFNYITNPTLKSLYLPNGKHTLLSIRWIQGSRFERVCIVFLRTQYIRNVLQDSFFDWEEPLTRQITFQAWL